MRYLYWLLTIICQPFAILLLRKRLRNGKELPDRYTEKTGSYNTRRPSGKLIWIHVASIGEMNSVIPVIRKLAEHHPHIHFLVTSVTVTSAAVFARANLKNSIHQFAPLDCPLFVNRFLEHWQPDLGIFIDSELWPNLIQRAATQCRLIMLNARLSDRSFARWSRFKPTARYLYNHFSQIYPTSKDDMRKIAHFTDPGRIKYIGNLKYIAHPYETDTTALTTIKKRLGNRRSWLAVSTHPGEFTKVMQAHKLVKKRFPDLITIISPRHFYNASMIAQEAKQLSLKPQFHSEATRINEATDIYIIDQISSILLLYDLADIVFVGGSLIPHGGQNMLEAARFNCAILTGPHTHNFRDIMEDMLSAKAIIQQPTEEALACTLIWLTDDKAAVNKLKKNAMNFVSQHGNVLDETVEEIESYL